ncbi:MAG: DUF2254 domain-containing protein [Proteobacteria bacterium]|nr:DUF2254 domain-containing protein [Pseudomonadota bacterium]
MTTWLIPGVYLAVGIICGFIVPRLEQAYLPAYDHGVAVGSALAFFGAISSGMLALVGIVFAIAFVMVQFSTAAYSPRLVIMFTHRPILAHTLGIFFATFVMSLSAVGWTDRSGSGVVPVLTMDIVLVLVIVSLLAFALLIRSLNDLLIQNVLANVGESGRAVIGALFQRLPRGAAHAPEPGAVPDGPVTQTLVYSGHPRTITRFNITRLTALARAADAVIVLDCAVGDTVVEDTVLARVIGGRRPVPEPALLRAIGRGNGRTFEQDPKYAIRLLVDIGIRALSPAVNDPTTAVQAIDQIEDLLQRLGQSDLEAGRIKDTQGTLRVVLPMPVWADYLTLSFDEIRQYGMTSVQVLRRLRAALQSLADGAAPEDRRFAARHYLERLDAGVGGRAFDAEDTRNSLQVDRQGLGLSRGTGVRAAASARRLYDAPADHDPSV